MERQSPISYRCTRIILWLNGVLCLGNRNVRRGKMRKENLRLNFTQGPRVSRIYRLGEVFSNVPTPYLVSIPAGVPTLPTCQQADHLKKNSTNRCIPMLYRALWSLIHVGLVTVFVFVESWCQSMLDGSSCTSAYQHNGKSEPRITKTCWRSDHKTL